MDKEKDHQDLAHTNCSSWILYEKCNNIPHKVYLYIMLLQPTYIFCIRYLQDVCSFQSLTINTCHSCLPYITSSVRPYRFYDVAINIRYTVGVIFSSSNHLFCDPHHLKVNPKPLFHGYTRQFQNMNFQT